MTFGNLCAILAVRFDRVRFPCEFKGAIFLFDPNDRWDEKFATLAAWLVFGPVGR